MKRWHWLALVVVLLGGVAVAQYGGSPGGTDNPLFTSIWVTGAPGVFPGSGCTTYPGGGRVCGDNKGGISLQLPDGGTGVLTGPIIGNLYATGGVEADGGFILPGPASDGGPGYINQSMGPRICLDGPAAGPGIGCTNWITDIWDSYHSDIVINGGASDGGNASGIEFWFDGAETSYLTSYGNSFNGGTQIGQSILGAGGWCAAPIGASTNTGLPGIAIGGCSQDTAFYTPTTNVLLSFYAGLTRITNPDAGVVIEDSWDGAPLALFRSDGGHVYTGLNIDGQVGAPATDAGFLVATTASLVSTSANFIATVSGLDGGAPPSTPMFCEWGEVSFTTATTVSTKFQRTFTSAPLCVCSLGTETSGTVGPQKCGSSTTQFTLTEAASSTGQVNYICCGQ